MTSRTARPRRRDVDATIDRFNRRLTGWVLGPGLLSFHAGVFFVTMTALFFWNAYHDPTNVWVVDLLRRWGAVLILHGVVTLGATVGWRLLRAADIQEATPRAWHPAPQPADPGIAVGQWRALDAPRRAEPPVASAIVIPEIPRESAARRLRMRAAERLATLRHDQVDQTSDGATGWPEPPTRRDSDADELIRQFGTGPTGPTDPALAERPRKPGQTRWAWVEASATNWLTKKDGATGGQPDRKPRVEAPPPPPASAPDDDAFSGL